MITEHDKLILIDRMIGLFYETGGGDSDNAEIYTQLLNDINVVMEMEEAK